MNPNATSTIRLAVRGLGHVPSFKNSKMLTRGRLITNPENQKWMKECIERFVSILCCEYRMREDGMETERSRRSWTASVLPLDDSVKWIPGITVKVERVAKGCEGADIEITPL